MNKEVDLKEIQKEMQEKITENLVEELIQNNEKEFKYKEETYRVRRPTFKERQEAYEMKNRRYLEMIREMDEKGNSKWLSEADLKALYKKRGTDLDALDNKVRSLEKKKNEYNMKLGKALEDKAIDSELEVYKNEIDTINQEENYIILQKAQLLEYSIERQVFIYFYTYLTYLITEKKAEDKWLKVWASFEEFKNSSEDLVNEVSIYASAMFQNEF